MPNFKPKTNKKIDIDEKSIVTVDTKHNQLLKQFKQEETTIDSLNKEKSTIKKRLKHKQQNKLQEAKLIEISIM